MSRQKNLKRNLLICLLAGSAVMYTLPLHAATSVVANNALPENGHFVNDKLGTILKNPNNSLEMNITQSVNNAVITWDKFDVGGSATVNFWGPDNHNTLNYVNSANMSQIYGTINANNNGNIFIVNPAGVQIGNSAQINVGSLYVSNKYLNENKLAEFDGSNINSLIDTTKTANAELMSLGNINAANNVTFDGNRIVLDTDRVIITDPQNGKLNIKTTDTNNVVLGYEAYDENTKYQHTVGNEANFDVTKVTVENGNISEKTDTVKGYMWVEDVEQLQAINTNLSGNYALRNSIDATGTTNWSDPEVDGKNEGFLPIGIHNDGKVYETTVDGETKYGFYGNFDGVDYNIFGLTINREDTNNVGLFGVAHDANINNVTLVGGSITGGSVVGSVVGAALGNTHITNATNSASVTGNADVGGIVGYSGNKISDGDNGNINVSDTDSHFTNLINTGAVYSKGESDGKTDTISNTGGLIGYMYNGTLDGNSYNLGDVSGKGYNVGGLVGHAVNSTIGDGTNLVYNRLDVEGKYNVGGIVGNMDGTTVQNAENSGTVMATGHTTEYYKYHTGETVKDNLPNDADLSSGIASVKVDVANAGGIAGTSSASNDGTVSKIENVTNTANVSSKTNTYEQNGSKHEYYTAGNVGGIVGRAEDTNITNATNRENEMRGAHNVGGVAGYFGGTGTVSGGINDGGDIMATGARYNDNFVRELIRPVGNSNESFIIGNIGGVVGYMDGDNVYVTGSANRGTVHSQDIAAENAANVLDTSKAANVGGVVGKIDRSDTKGLVEIKNNTSLAAVNNSYNTGDVRGYTGVGGVVGMMYNGEVASSYNLGYLRTTRIATNGENIEAVNMGGIVGDTTEGSRSKGVIIYDVYNKGQIGDDTYTYYARHVAGIVGRLSGTVEKAYNNGEIYNGYTATAGIAGWMYEGSINNAFNTGNITVYNHDSSTSQVGGIVGAAGVANGDINLTNVYNLGTLRSFKAVNDEAISGVSHNVGDNSVAGIIGAVLNNQHKLIINGAYTTGNIYAGIQQKDGSIIADGGYTVMDGTNIINNIHVGSIYSENRGEDNKQAQISLTNTYYIAPQKELQDNGYFQDLSEVYAGNGNNVPWIDKDNSNKAIDYGARSVESSYQYIDETGYHKLSFSSQSGGNVTGDRDDNWRLYDDTPILNAFLPDSEKYFDQYETDDALANAGMSDVQYGTAYDPLLTIVTANEKANGNLTFEFGNSDDGKLAISNAAGLVVHDAGLTLNGFTTSGGSGYYGGLIYSDGKLIINAVDGEGLGFGSGSDLYGSSVTLNADGTVTVYGDVVATGNGTKTGDDPDEAGSINIISDKGDVNVYGTLTSAQAEGNVVVPGISATADSDWKPADSVDKLNDPKAHLNTIGDRFEVDTDKSAVSGNINITADGVKDDKGELISGGNVNLYYGNKQEGLITTGGDLNVTGTGDVYVDSDLDIGGDLTLTGNSENSEVVLDLTNIGQVQAKNELAENPNSNVTALDKFHDFMHHFGSQIDDDNQQIMLNAKISGDAKLTIDMWDKTQNNGQGGYNLNKYDQNTGHDLVTELNNLNINADIKTNNGTIGNVTSAKPITYIWVSDGDQLQAINNNGVNGLSYNYALKNDINASDVTGYEAIGGTTGFTGTFDGRGNRIIGLDTTKNDNGTNTNFMANAGIFSTIGEGGTVKNVNIYSGNFTGTAKAGAVAGENNGRIEGVVTFGNTVTVTGEGGNAGGIVGVNNGNNGKIVTNEDGTITLEPVDDELPVTGIIDVESTGSVIAGGSSAVAGGLVGTNDGALGNSYSNSAVTANKGTGSGLGGVVGVNTANGNVQYVDSLGVTNGGAHLSNNVGGIIGINNGNMYSGYNESIVSGKDNVGGIIGENDGGNDYKVDTDGTVTWNKGTVENVVNATGVTGSGNKVGGLLGTNTGSVTNGRNNGTITGTNYVGGIAGTNAGTITAQNQANLINRGSITGQNYVGGVAGENIGTIEYVNNDVSLNVKDTTEKASYFGGVAGINGRVDDDPDDGVDNNKKGTITNATNEGNVIAPNADYVGGIVGHNTVNGVLDGMGNSNDGRVEGATYVGGVAGKNDAAITGAVNDMVGIENNGVVIAHKGGAGGIFGENTGDIKYAELTNNGIVSGTYSNNDVAGTGGIFGVNSGDITYSSLKNNIGGQVIGTQNVGGLIGINTGTITGGRIEADGTDADYYKYQIYNNGVINVGTWTDNADSTAEGYGKVDANEFKAAAGSNIGGLIGNNAVVDSDQDNVKTGSLTAGYNTGVINAENSTNVGGIAGSNSGTIDQVFNTVYNTDGTKGAITGGTNVGGLVGTNSGTLSNAYNTTGVEGATNFGNAVGVNTNKVENIYGYSELVGNGNEATNSYVINNSDEWKQQEKYIGFDFTTSDNTPAIWKNYDGYGNPLLKVFLTKAKYKGDEKFTYNATDQGLTINSTTIAAADELNAYNNANSLLTATQNKNAGKDYLGIYSQQIAASGKGDAFDPNNLGYDIDVTYDIKKAQLNITLDDVHRVYGNVAISNNNQNSIKNEAGYGYSYKIANGEFNNTMKAELANDGITFTQKNDGAVDGVSGNKVTNDAGDYIWSADFVLNNDNYTFIVNGAESKNTTVKNGVSKVTQADLTITADDQYTMPGVMPEFTGKVEGLTNGDDALLDYVFGLGANGNSIINVDGRYDNAIGIVVDGKYYELNAAWTDGLFKNYNVTYNMGTLTVDSEIMPDLPDNWPNNRWDYLFGDNPFDRNENFRERKAEVNFVDGAMEI